MDRHTIEPRPDWRTTVEKQGLLYWPTELPSGDTIAYWNEGTYYSLTTAEATDMEASVRILMEMLVEAGDFIIRQDLFHMLGIPQWVTEHIRRTWDAEPPMLLGRFDFGLAADGSLKLLEYNCDAPAALLETAIQWHWAVDHFGEGVEQWNEVHEALVEQLRHYREQLPRLHMLYSKVDKQGEDFLNVSYVAEIAREAGIESVLLPIDAVGESDRGFVDLAGERIRYAYKLYPWEYMVQERYGRLMAQWYGDGSGSTTLWIEPIWKMMWSNKGILPILWHLFPDHPNLLPAAFERDGRHVGPLGAPVDVGGTLVRKPVYGFEGADVRIFDEGTEVEHGPEEGFGQEGVIVQAFTDLGTYDGQHPVLGIWTVDVEPVALGIREHENLITNRYARFAPHVIANA